MAARSPMTPNKDASKGGLPFPAGLTTSIGSYNMLASKSPGGSVRSSSPSAGVDTMSAGISNTLQWFARRPILALVVFILTILLGSVFVPFLILDYFSASFAPPSAATGTNQLFALTSSKGGQEVLRQNLQQALGIDNGKLSPELSSLKRHAAGYVSALHEKEEYFASPVVPGETDALDAAQIQRHRDERAAVQAEIAAREGVAANVLPVTVPEVYKDEHQLALIDKALKEQKVHAANGGHHPSAAVTAISEDQPKNPPPPSAPPAPPVSPPTPLAPPAPPVSQPTIVTPTPAAGDSSAQPQRQAEVIAAFKHAYGAYERSCMGQDEYHPLTRRCSNWIGSGLTIIDALPTMMLMGLGDEVARARKWIQESLSFTTQHSQISFFETTIRVLGGLISAYDLQGDAIYLQRARELGDKLLLAFQSPTGLPHSQINLATGQTGDYGWTGGNALLAEVGTCQMEFFALSQRTGDSKYKIAAQKPIDLIDNQHTPDSIYPIYLNGNTGLFSTASKVSFGAMGDSFYEYLLKVWLLTGKKKDQYKRMYLASMEGMISRLVTNNGVPNGDYTFIADLNFGRKDNKMDHLVCFVPGMLALGVEEGIVTGAAADRHMQVAKSVMRTCFESYNTQPSKIGPEFMTFNGPMGVGDASYKLRPEMVESLFVMWRITKDTRYRDWGWQTFQAINAKCKVQEGGYAALYDVRDPTRREDKMESFFLAETLKYFYLLFSDDSALVLTGNRKPGEYYVFNTECHPIKSWEEA